MYSGFLQGSDASKSRYLRTMARVTVAVAVVGFLLAAFVLPRVWPEDDSLMSVTVRTPSIGPGLVQGTPVVLRGVEVGEVTSVGSGRSDITVKLRLDKASTAGLARDMTIDYRPSSYFGVTAVNIVSPGDLSTTGALRNGDKIQLPGGADYTMSTMIARGSVVVAGSLTDSMAGAIEKMLTYTDALSPLLNAGAVVADTVERTQQDLPEQTLVNVNKVVSAMPSVLGGGADALYYLYSSNLRTSGDELLIRLADSIESIAVNFFGLIGKVLGSHAQDLAPLMTQVEAAAGILPGIAGGVLTPESLRTLLTKLNGAFSAGPRDSRILNVRLNLRMLPALDVPLGASVRSQPSQSGRGHR